MASSSSSTLQASPNQQVQSCFRNPLLFDPLGLELALSIWEMKRRFPVLLTLCMLEYLEKCPCELWKLFQPGGPSNHSGSAHVTSGCFCNQAEKRPTVAASEQPLPSIQEDISGDNYPSSSNITDSGSGGSNSNSLSQNDKILVRSATACNIIGFVCCLLGIVVCGRKPEIAARITTGIGYIATVYGFVAVMGMLLRDNLKLWITAAACAASFPGLAYVFLK
ncbi:hypothetical protein Pint_25944 [Pistacia integerrima]|uniref:Uncharacterized protein n=1 Tax=Pistacia integerrima TaxID=434235 RepID=A0ACC0YGE8_9ROSI|nr:hypothetical protein Pint_25944 [Pistacia integerrima]